MKTYWESLQDVLIDRSAPELVGALALALLVALAVTGLYQLAIRKIRDSVMLMTGLMLVGCAISMALAAGFVEHSRRMRRPQFSPSARIVTRPDPLVRLPGQVAHRILALADRDADGFLSAEEAADAAAAFTRKAEEHSKGPLGVPELADALRETVLPRQIPLEPPQGWHVDLREPPARQDVRAERTR